MPVSTCYQMNRGHQGINIITKKDNIFMFMFMFIMINISYFMCDKSANPHENGKIKLIIKSYSSFFVCFAINIAISSWKKSVVTHVGLLSCFNVYFFPAITFVIQIGIEWYILLSIYSCVILWFVRTSLNFWNFSKFFYCQGSFLAFYRKFATTKFI